MNKHMKQLTLAISALLLLSTSAMACGGKACSATNCEYKAAHGQAFAYGSVHGTVNKKSAHHNLPGNKPTYIRMILKKGDVIGLTDKQRKQIGELLIAAETGAVKAHAEAEVVVAGFRSRLHSGELKDGDIKAYARRMGDLRAAKYEANLMASVKASRLLDDEQKSKLHAGKKTMGANK